MSDVSLVMQAAIDEAEAKLSELNLDIHSHPELGYQEHHAHDAIVRALRSLGFTVTPHAYDIPTSFLADYGSGGRLVVFNAEYDALPKIGHACGHNLIMTASFSGFIAATAALKHSGKPGRVRLLGTPAEEGGGGKALLISRGAYEGVDACVMAHPTNMTAMGKTSLERHHIQPPRRGCFVYSHRQGEGIPRCGVAMERPKRAGRSRGRIRPC